MGRYSLDPEYINNREKIKDCDITFIAVPTPTTPRGFDAGIVTAALENVGEGKIAVIKSTIVPGTTKNLQKIYPGKIVLYSPEFLSEATAKHDTDNPFSNIVGCPNDSAVCAEAAQKVGSVLPPAGFNLTCDSTEAEIIKYSHNLSGYFQIVLFNMIYDLANKFELNWEHIQKAIEADPFISNRYAKPVHKSGRGAGGNCYVKDFTAFKNLYAQMVGDEEGKKAFEAIEQKNISLLINSNKDKEILKGVYGDKF